MRTVICLLVLAITTCISVVNFPRVDALPLNASAVATRALLLKLWYETGGPGWTVQPWGESPTPCDWPGVVCCSTGQTRQYKLTVLGLYGTDVIQLALPCARAGDLMALELSGFNLSGQLPDSVSALSLQAVILTNNPGLAGSVPPSLLLSKDLLLGDIRKTSLSCQVAAAQTGSKVAACGLPARYTFSDTGVLGRGGSDILPAGTSYACSLLAYRNATSYAAYPTSAFKSIVDVETAANGLAQQLTTPLAQTQSSSSTFLLSDPAYWNYQSCLCLQLPGGGLQVPRRPALIATESGALQASCAMAPGAEPYGSEGGKGRIVPKVLGGAVAAAAVGSALLSIVVTLCCASRWRRRRERDGSKECDRHHVRMPSWLHLASSPPSGRSEAATRAVSEEGGGQRAVSSIPTRPLRRQASSGLGPPAKRSGAVSETLKRTNAPGFAGHGEQVTLVATDVEGSTELWEWQPDIMNHALALHDKLMRLTIATCCGYEITTEGDAFLVAFHEPVDAVRWALLLQSALLKLDWPPLLLEHPLCRPRPLVPVAPTGPASDPPLLVLFKGLAVRMGIATGVPSAVREHPVTRRMQYTGAVLRLATGIAELGSGGQVLVEPLTFKGIHNKFEELDVVESEVQQLADVVRQDTTIMGPSFRQNASQAPYHPSPPPPGSPATGCSGDVPAAAPHGNSRDIHTSPPLTTQRSLPLSYTSTPVTSSPPHNISPPQTTTDSSTPPTDQPPTPSRTISLIPSLASLLQPYASNQHSNPAPVVPHPSVPPQTPLMHVPASPTNAPNTLHVHAPAPTASPGPINSSRLRRLGDLTLPVTDNSGPASRLPTWSPAWTFQYQRAMASNRGSMAAPSSSYNAVDWNTSPTTMMGWRGSHVHTMSGSHLSRSSPQDTPGATDANALMFSSGGSFHTNTNPSDMPIQRVGATTSASGPQPGSTATSTTLLDQSATFRPPMRAPTIINRSTSSNNLAEMERLAREHGLAYAQSGPSVPRLPLPQLAGLMMDDVFGLRRTQITAAIVEADPAVEAGSLPSTIPGEEAAGKGQAGGSGPGARRTGPGPVCEAVEEDGDSEPGVEDTPSGIASSGAAMDAAAMAQRPGSQEDSMTTARRTSVALVTSGTSAVLSLPQQPPTASSLGDSDLYNLLLEMPIMYQQRSLGESSAGDSQQHSARPGGEGPLSLLSSPRGVPRTPALGRQAPRYAHSPRGEGQEGSLSPEEQGDAATEEDGQAQSVPLPKTSTRGTVAFGSATSYTTGLDTTVFLPRPASSSSPSVELPSTTPSSLMGEHSTQRGLALSPFVSLGQGDSGHGSHTMQICAALGAAGIPTQCNQSTGTFGSWILPTYESSSVRKSMDLVQRMVSPTMSMPSPPPSAHEAGTESLAWPDTVFALAPASSVSAPLKTVQSAPQARVDRQRAAAAPAEGIANALSSRPGSVTSGASVAGEWGMADGGGDDSGSGIGSGGAAAVDTHSKELPTLQHKALRQQSALPASPPLPAVSCGPGPQRSSASWTSSWRRGGMAESAAVASPDRTVSGEGPDFSFALSSKREAPRQSTLRRAETSRMKPLATESAWIYGTVQRGAGPPWESQSHGAVQPQQWPRSPRDAHADTGSQPASPNSPGLLPRDEPGRRGVHPSAAVAGPERHRLACSTVRSEREVRGEGSSSGGPRHDSQNPLKLGTLVAAFRQSIAGRPPAESLATTPATSVHSDTPPTRPVPAKAAKLANVLAAVPPGVSKDTAALIASGAAVVLPAAASSPPQLFPTVGTSLSQLRFEDALLPFPHHSSSGDDPLQQYLMLEGALGGYGVPGYPPPAGPGACPKVLALRGVLGRETMTSTIANHAAKQARDLAEDDSGPLRSDPQEQTRAATSASGTPNTTAEGERIPAVAREPAETRSGRKTHQSGCALEKCASGSGRSKRALGVLSHLMSPRREDVAEEHDADDDLPMMMMTPPGSLPQYDLLLPSPAAAITGNTPGPARRISQQRRHPSSPGDVEMAARTVSAISNQPVERQGAALMPNSLLNALSMARMSVARLANLSHDSREGHASSTGSTSAHLHRMVRRVKSKSALIKSLALRQSRVHRHGPVTIKDGAGPPGTTTAFRPNAPVITTPGSGSRYPRGKAAAAAGEAPGGRRGHVGGGGGGGGGEGEETDGYHPLIVIDMGVHSLTIPALDALYGNLYDGVQVIQLLPAHLKHRAAYQPPLRSQAQLSPSFFDAPGAAQALLPNGPPSFPRLSLMFIQPAGCSAVANANLEVAERSGAVFCAAVREVLHVFGAYECQEYECTFMVACTGPRAAAEAGLALHEWLLQVDWPSDLLDEFEAGRVVLSDTGRPLLRGFRAKVGIFTGVPLSVVPHATTGRADYFGALVNRAARLMAGAKAGQILLDKTAGLEVVREWRQMGSAAHESYPQDAISLPSDARSCRISPVGPTLAYGNSGARKSRSRRTSVLSFLPGLVDAAISGGLPATVSAGGAYQHFASHAVTSSSMDASGHHLPAATYLHTVTGGLQGDGLGGPRRTADGLPNSGAGGGLAAGSAAGSGPGQIPSSSGLPSAAAQPSVVLSQALPSAALSQTVLELRTAMGGLTPISTAAAMTTAANCPVGLLPAAVALANRGVLVSRVVQVVDLGEFKLKGLQRGQPVVAVQLKKLAGQEGDALREEGGEAGGCGKAQRLQRGSGLVDEISVLLPVPPGAGGGGHESDELVPM